MYKQRHLRSHTPYETRRHRLLVFTLLGLSLTLLSYRVLVSRYRRQLRSYVMKPVYKDKELVFAATSMSDMSWVVDELPTWSANIYRTDSEDAVLPVPVNKGNEAMAYLTFVPLAYSRLVLMC